MDIVTHACVGIIAAAPFVSSQPDLAAGLLWGSILPDLDSFSRVFGKRAFLCCHQTFTHSLPGIVILAALGGLMAWVGGLSGSTVAAGLFLGMVLHSLMDVSNTLGVAILAPFSSRRFRLEWVFFIDAWVLTASLCSAAGVLLTMWEPVLASRWSIGFFVFVLIYWACKGILRRKAGTTAPPGTVSLIPSAILPWVFLGARRTEEGCDVFRLDLFHGTTVPMTTYPVLDDVHGTVVTQLPEFKVMRLLSPAYHVVDAQTSENGTELLCRDLRTRNFGTTFGDLRVWLDPTGQILKIHFHV